MARKKFSSKHTPDETMEPSSASSSASTSSSSSINSTDSNLTKMDPVMINSDKALHLLNQYTEEISNMIQDSSKEDLDDEYDTNSNVNIDIEDMNRPMSSIHAKFQHISQVGDDLKQAWNDLTQSNNENDPKDDNDEKNINNDIDPNEEEFRSVYMNLVTEAFSDELDALRSNNIAADTIAKSTKNSSKKRKKKESTNEETFHMVDSSNQASKKEAVIDLNVLIDCLESGMDVFTKEERMLMMDKL